MVILCFSFSLLLEGTHKKIDWGCVAHFLFETKICPFP